MTGDIMDIMTLLILLALAGVVASLVSGVATMAHHGPIGHHSGEDWMFRRVGFQALALALILLALLSAAG
jgi:hypothetical protein